MKKKNHTLSIILILTALALCFLLYFVTRPVEYATNDPADYGSYITIYGNTASVAEKCITQFFPAELSDNFQDISYSYRSSTVDRVAFEAFLEFTIEDNLRFQEYVATVTEGITGEDFYFDQAFREFVIISPEPKFYHDSLWLGDLFTNSDGESYYPINHGWISKILVNDDENRIIYISLGVHDGGGTGTDFLNVFFTRFGIDPKEYETYTMIKRSDFK